MLTIQQVETLRAEFLARLNIPTPKTATCRIKISNTMRTTAGRAYYRTNTIELNSRLLNANPGEVYQTVAHELAHLVSVEYYGLTFGRGHGSRWKGIMRQFGVNPERCHAMNTIGLKRRHKTHTVYCKCPTKHVKTIRYNKMRRGAVYRCGVCQSIIYLTKQIMEVFNGTVSSVSQK